VLREMVREFAQRNDGRRRRGGLQRRVRGGDRGPVNSRNGYRRPEWDTRAGTIELAVPKLRHGSYFPAFPEHRRRAERALASVVATSHLLPGTFPWAVLPV